MHISVCIQNSHNLKSRDNNRANADVLLLYFYLLFPVFLDIFVAFIALVLYPDTSVRKKNILHFIDALKLTQTYAGTGCVYEYRCIHIIAVL